ncbi:MAG: MarR family transcriptional regulator [Burkholderiales bacterium]|nr:MarR family transcriptional regulator [Anaerolineae bacterium]
MELPFHLKTLPPDALDVIRFFGGLAESTAHADDIADGADLSDRAFGKSIRRLVTKGYLQMDGDQIYRLTEQGHKAVEELAEYDDEATDDDDGGSEMVETMQRDLVLALSKTLIAGEQTEIFVGFNPAELGETLPDGAEANIVVRLGVINGQPASQEATFELGNEADYTTFGITAGNFTKLRLRAQVFQLGPNPDDISVSGGMYVDINVVADFAQADLSLTAYRASVSINPPE